MSIAWCAPAAPERYAYRFIKSAFDACGFDVVGVFTNLAAFLIVVLVEN